MADRAGLKNCRLFHRWHMASSRRLLPDGRFEIIEFPECSRCGKRPQDRRTTRAVLR